MRKIAVVIGLLSVAACQFAWAEDGDRGDDTKAETNAADQLDLTPGTGSNRRPPPKLNEDQSIKIRVEPVIVGNLVDRVVEPAKVFVEAPGALSVEVFLLPVDAPYGGKPLSTGKSLGVDTTPRDGFSFAWDKPEPYKYAKIFAVVHRRDAPSKAVRSRTIDVAVSGRRYRPDLAPPPAPPHKEVPTETSENSAESNPESGSGNTSETETPPDDKSEATNSAPSPPED